MSNYPNNWNSRKWITHLQELLAYRPFAIELNDLKTWVAEIHYPTRSLTAPRLIQKIKFDWNFWVRHFKVVSPRLFNFLEEERLFVTGRNFLSTASQWENPTLINLIVFHHRYPIENILHSLEDSIRATIIILSNHFQRFNWVLSVFATNELTQTIALKLVRFIQPTTHFFHRKQRLFHFT